MISVAVVGILAAIALPNYSAYIMRSHRAEARNTLLAVAQRLEQNYTLAGTYAATPAGAAINNASITAWGLDQIPLSGAARYTITFATGQPTATTFTLQATPTGPQAGDTCGVLMLDNRNLKGSGGAISNRSTATRNCWDR